MKTIDAITVANVAFWILLSLVVFLPVRWAVVAFLILVQFDLAGVDHSSLDSLGIVNAIRVVVVPTLLLLRIRPIRPLATPLSRLRNIWILYILYAALAVFWSPYRVPAIKMLGYFYAYSVLFVVFTNAWQREWFNARILAFVVWVSLLLGFLQTYFLGNAYGNPDYESRFTSFSGAQSFAPFMLSLFALLLFREKWSFSVIAAAIAATVGLVLTGSRSIFIGFAWIVLIGGVILAQRSGKKINVGLIGRRVIISGAILLSVGGIVLNVIPGSRLNKALVATVSQNATLEDVGIFGWRYNLYQETLTSLRARSLKQLFAGSGTSSGATLVTETGIFLESEVDPNRALHDEFLRSVYEWGVPGLVLLLLFLVESGRICVRM